MSGPERFEVPKLEGPSRLADLFAIFDGREVPGGCLDCDAVHRFWQDELGLRITVLHDNTCPWYVARRRRIRL